MTTDLNETIEIDSDDITLDGNGHTLTGYGTGNGVFLPGYISGRTGVTVKNLNINNFSNGIALYYSNSINITSNTIDGCRGYGGIWLFFVNNSNFIGNTITNNSSGIIITAQSNFNTITGNIINYNSNDGIYITDGNANNSHDNIITGNTINSNVRNGFY